MCLQRKISSVADDCDKSSESEASAEEENIEVIIDYVESYGLWYHRKCYEEHENSIGDPFPSRHCIVCNVPDNNLADFLSKHRKNGMIRECEHCEKEVYEVHTY